MEFESGPRGCYYCGTYLSAEADGHCPECGGVYSGSDADKSPRLARPNHDQSNSENRTEN